jgi:uroporphyrinogen decarboxylase
MLTNLPVQEPHPNAGEFIDILMGHREETRVPLVEYIVDEALMRPVVTDLLEREWVPNTGEPDSLQGWLDSYIEFWHRMGYDCVRLEIPSGFLKKNVVTADTAGMGGQRGWSDEHEGSITNWDDFEQYPWPSKENINLFPLEYINGHLPDGMGLLSSHCGGIFEQVSGIMSLEGLCLALLDDPKLVEAVAEKVGEQIEAFYEHLLQLDRVVAVLGGDDMGFRTQTLIAPDDLRKYFLPWHKRFAQMTHERGIPYFLHSCGQIKAVMEDLIEDVKIDGKHSYEDVIIPVEDFQARYGDRIAVLGGLDVHTLSYGSSDDVRKRTRQLIETCGPRGRYAIGSGNSIPSYVPLENYLAMVDEALR